MNLPGHNRILLADYRPPAYLVDRVRLDISLHPNETRVHSRLTLRPNPKAEHPAQPLVLNGEFLSLEWLALNETTMGASEYECSESALTLPRPPYGPFELEISTLCAPDANAALSGLYRSNGIYCTQCEAEGFRRITYFPDRPDVLSVYTTRIEADREEAPILLSNGNPVGHDRIAGTNRHYVEWHDPHPKPSYLFALVGGQLSEISDNFTTATGRPVTLKIYVEPGKEDGCAYAMDSLKRAMRWDEERFGREYDLDVFMIVAVPDFNMGAMENKGLNIFNDRFILARPDTATDIDYANIEAIIAHEYFHNWTGNRVTCRDWFQLCLKEGLTVFRDQEFTGDTRTRAVERIGDVRELRNHQFPEDAGPLAHSVRPESFIEINNFYTSTVYEKGAELIRMIQTMVGREGFRQGMDLYFERCDGSAATVEDFLTALEDASGRDLTQFKLWYSQAGTPELTCTLDYDPHSQSAELQVSQLCPPTPDQPSKAPMHIPLAFALIGQNGQEAELPAELRGPAGGGLLHITAREQRFRFDGIASRPVPSLLREFSAPVNLTANLTTDDLEFLMVHDADLFNRWQAAQTYATQTLLAVITALRNGQPAPNTEAFVQALALPLCDEELPPAYRAELLTLPSEADLARELARDVDPDAIHQAREALRAEIGTRLRTELSTMYDRHMVAGPYSPDVEGVGKRRLRNTALSVLAASRQEADMERVTKHFETADNMTDSMAALSILTHVDGKRRTAALQLFHDHWHDNLLVLDKWFAVQAVSTRAQVVNEVKTLMQHPAFSMKRPNRVRALIGSFANQNPVGFNRRDGAGFEFVADAVLEIDRFNPQVAARLLGAFKSWRTLETERRSRAQLALRRIGESDGLSRDVYEIVTNTLK